MAVYFKRIFQRKKPGAIPCRIDPEEFHCTLTCSDALR